MASRSNSTETGKPRDATRNASQRDRSAQRDEMAQHARSLVQRFLDRFASAITTGNTKAVAELWETPAFVIDDRAAIPVADLEEVERFFQGAKDQYNAQGITTTKAEILDLDWVSDGLVLVRVRWPYLDDAGKVLGAESSSYILKRDDNGDFKLRVILMRGVETSDDRAPHGKN